MSNTPTDLIKWIKGKPLWLQEAAKRLRASGGFSPSDEIEFAELCKRESLNTDAVDEIDISEDIFKFSGTSNSIKLKSISEPKGIDELNPSKPLSFDTGTLSIIYGENGSGKSGYVRILKQICGARAARELLSNAFSSTTQPQSCKVAFSLNGVDNEIIWQPAHRAHKDLRAVEIYDSDAGRIYTNQENEVLYEPPILNFFQQLIEASAKIERIILDETKSLVSKKPDLPPEHTGTKAAKWYANDISATTTDSIIDTECLWDEAKQAELNSLNTRIAKANPADEAKQLRKRKKAIEELAQYLTTQRTSLDDETLKKIADARQDAVNKRKVASEDAQKVFAQAPLSGIGEESWKLLWEQAREYSTKVAYKDMPFPNIGTGARCLLCQQELQPDTKIRLTSFENFVKSNLEVEAKKAEKTVDTLLNKLPTLNSSELFSSKLTALLITDTDSVNLLTTHHNALLSRLESIKNNTTISTLPSEEAITELKVITDGLETTAKEYDKDADKEGRAALQAQAKELSAQKWVAEQKGAITSERNRLISVQQLDKARKLLDTTALSKKKTQLTTEIITDAFVQRFEDELKALGAGHIKVEIVKTGTSKGLVKHQVKLKGAHGKVKTGDVLSEGEQRIVSIAAFLAESEGTNANTPFIFDDPISSLDQNFENATVRRLVKLSQKRQVIVFTHRASFAISLDDVAKHEKAEPVLINLQRNSLGTGEPSDKPLFVMNPKSLINLLLNDRVPKIRKIYNDQGLDDYKPMAEGVCTEIRKAIERLIEMTLLSQVVLRFREPITTNGRIKNLAKINSTDCQMIDELMTKYSMQLHQRSLETPVAHPLPDEIETDLKCLQAWLKDFEDRQVP